MYQRCQITKVNAIPYANVDYLILSSQYILDSGYLVIVYIKSLNEETNVKTYCSAFQLKYRNMNILSIRNIT